MLCLKIERHGARFPTASAGARINATVQKIKSASSFTDPKLRFLQTYTYNLGTDNLVPFGALQYVHLIGNMTPPDTIYKVIRVWPASVRPLPCIGVNVNIAICASFQFDTGSRFVYKLDCRLCGS
jgi:hypothetical protein